MTLQRLSMVAFWTVLTFTSSASAHPDSGGFGGGLSAGLAHPLLGWDHLLVAVGVGVVAARIGGRTRVVLPLVFLGFMVAGGVVGVQGLSLAFGEVLIASSVVMVGLAIALDWHRPTVGLTILIAAFGFFHGHMHGTEMPAAVGAAMFALGFVATTGILHVSGIALVHVCQRTSVNTMAVRWAGAATAGAGIGLAFAQ
jgi:urease accessory protein